MALGINNFDLFKVHRLMAGGRVLELGSQDVFVQSENDLKSVNSFIEQYGGKKKLTCDKIPSIVPAVHIWRKAGFEYNCVDVDERDYAHYLDLHSFEYPSHWRSAFDFVGNSGTIEHMALPLYGLNFLHYACKKGGIILHEVPLFGYGCHGINRPTPKFWDTLIRENKYEVLYAKVQKNDDSQMHWSQFYLPHMSYFEGLEPVKDISYMLHMILRKTTDDPFNPPLDTINPNPKKDIEMKLQIMKPFVQSGVWDYSSYDFCAPSAPSQNRPKSFLKKLKSFFVKLLKTS